jgi:hypothetical protein
MDDYDLDSCYEAEEEEDIEKNRKNMKASCNLL